MGNCRGRIFFWSQPWREKRSLFKARSSTRDGFRTPRSVPGSASTKRLSAWHTPRTSRRVARERLLFVSRRAETFIIAQSTNATDLESRGRGDVRNWNAGRAQPPRRYSTPGQGGRGSRGREANEGRSGIHGQGRQGIREGAGAEEAPGTEEGEGEAIDAAHFERRRQHR